MHAASFYKFGAEQVFAISAEHSLGMADLLDAIADRVTEEPGAADAGNEGEIAVAVVGRPNVGKSSLVNQLLGFERSIVTDVPGTTRDAVDTLVEHEGVRYRLIDTAGTCLLPPKGASCRARSTGKNGQNRNRTKCRH